MGESNVWIFLNEIDSKPNNDFLMGLFFLKQTIGTFQLNWSDKENKKQNSDNYHTIIIWLSQFFHRLLFAAL